MSVQRSVREGEAWCVLVLRDAVSGGRFLKERGSSLLRTLRQKTVSF